MKTLLFLASLILAASNPLPAAPDSPSAPAPAKSAPFRLIFKSYDGDSSGNLNKMSFQIDTLDLRQPSEFLKLGETIPHTHLKLTKYAYKVQRNQKLGEDEDASELTLVDTNTGKTTVLQYNNVTDVSGDGSPTAPATK
jgi:hypothetical protein